MSGAAARAGAKCRALGSAGGMSLEQQEGARAVGFSPRFHSIFENYSGNLAQVKAELIFNKGFQHLV